MAHSQAAPRRSFVRSAAAFAGSMLAGLGPIRRAAAAAPNFINDPFQLGVASGDPNTDGFVIWTRLAPDPYDPAALPVEAIPVGWEVAEDAKFRKIAARGTVYARPELAHSVHVDLRGLGPHRDYFYRFTCGDAVSPVGRGATWPAPTAPADKLRFAFGSCQHYEQGYFSAYRDMVAQDPSLIIHLGDYIYDVSYGRTVRHSPIADARTLADYRQLHAVYKLDPDLQAAHRHCPWLFVWDDHEVDNDYSAIDSEDDADPAAFLARRRAAYQAYYEHMPLRASAGPTASGNMFMFQRINYGDLAEFNQLDLRQYRAPIVCKTPTFRAGRVVDVTQCPELADPSRTMLGAQQEFWIDRHLGRTGARWTVIAQSLMLMGFDQIVGPARGVYTDNWAGFPAARRKVFDIIKKRSLQNVISLGGDIHSYVVGDAKDIDADPASATLLSEFVCTSITSESFNTSVFAAMAPENPNIKLIDDRYRGYVLCDVDRNVWRTTLRTVDDVMDRNTGFGTLATFAVEQGQPGVKPG